MSKLNIMASGNVVIPCYLALLEKGYAVRREEKGAFSETECWVAENSTCRFVADGPEILLGLVGLYEMRGDDWKASDEEIEAFLTRFYPNV